MSRCQKWNSALSGLAKTVQQSGLKTNNANFKEEKKVIDQFCSKEKIEGSFSERVLKVSENYNQFKAFVKDKANNVQ